MLPSSRWWNPALRRLSAAVLALTLVVPTQFSAPPAHAADPTVTLAGSLQSEAGCSADWQADCAATHLALGADGIYRLSLALPAGSYEYKVALNDSWTENYGAGGVAGGDNLALNLGAAATVIFYYDPTSHWITSNKNAVIATAVGDFQSEAGCAGDWQPGCLTTWLEDLDGDGTYTWITTALPAGTYQGKVAINEGWDENYGAGGAPGGDNITFTVPLSGTRVRFSYNSATHLLSISAGHAQDGNVEYDGLAHNSQSDVYRVPFGAVNPGTAVTLRFRTYHNDATGVRLRLYSTATSSETFTAMEKVADGVSCYEAALASESCDFWAITLTPSQIGTLYYRFVVSDGSATAYYADDSYKDGGAGVATASMEDNSYVITVFDPVFQPIPWMQNAVIYQIFPDRFRNGDTSNDPTSSDVRYDSATNPLAAILKKGWGGLPEGACSKYVNPSSACDESPRGRDYFGGDLKGITAKLDYLQALGVNTIYMNPIFESGSNHGYDTQDYKQIDSFFGSQQDWNDLAAATQSRGMRLILDGVFNHVASDSAYFDRYHNYDTLGACESVSSPYRSWFTFTEQAGGPCAGPSGPNTMNYTGWYGFDSLPVLTKENASVRNLVYGGPDNVAAYWLNQGAAGWRLDVMGDGSFPASFWKEFRSTVKTTDADAPIIGELWKKDEALPKIQGDQADTVMNYRFRNAILGYFGKVDNKGFADDGQSNLPPSLFARKIMSTREDYPDAVFFTSMNLMDSHDTQRILWSLTPGEENPEQKEQNAANLAQGKQNLLLAALVQMTMPGAPTIYYGDEVALNGADDPDDRRSFPWTDLTETPTATPTTPTATPTTPTATPTTPTATPTTPTATATVMPTPGSGGETSVIYLPLVQAGATQRQSAARSTDPAYGAGGDQSVLAGYRSFTALRTANPVLRDGDLHFLLTDDTSRTMAYVRRNADTVAIVAVNPGDAAQTLSIPTAGYVRDGLTLNDALASGAALTTADGKLTVALGARSAAVYISAAGQDLAAPAAPVSLSATSDVGKVDLSWSSVAGASSYVIFRSPLSKGGYAQVAEVAGTSYEDTGVTNGKHYYYVVKAADAAGNLSASSNEDDAVPALPVGYAKLDTAALTFERTATPHTVAGQVYVAGLTDVDASPALILAEVGYGAQGSDPATWTTWEPMAYAAKAVNNYSYTGSIRPEQIGSFDMLVRFSTNLGDTWAYGDVDGNPSPLNPGMLTVQQPSDTTAPAAPANVRVADWSAGFITVAWDAVADASLYRVYRATASGGPFSAVGEVASSATSYTDSTVGNGTTYWYKLVALDAALNASADSAVVSQTAAPKLVAVTFRVRVPDETPAGDTVSVVGDHSTLGAWSATGLAMTNLGGGIWEATVSIPDGTLVQYKYNRGAWERVEWWGGITSTANRSMTVAYGSDGTQLVDNTATDWGTGSDSTKAVQYWRDPLVASTSPADGASVPAPTSITVTWRREVQAPTSGDLSGVIVVKLGGVAVAGTVASTGADQYTFTPAAPLAAGSYTVVADQARSALGGDSVAMQKPYTWGFTVTE